VTVRRSTPPQFQRSVRRDPPGRTHGARPVGKELGIARIIAQRFAHRPCLGVHSVDIGVFGIAPVDREEQRPGLPCGRAENFGIRAGKRRQVARAAGGGGIYAEQVVAFVSAAVLLASGAALAVPILLGLPAVAAGAWLLWRQFPATPSP